MRWQVLPNNAKLHHNFATSIADSARKEYHFREAIRIYPPYGNVMILSLLARALWLRLLLPFCLRLCLFLCDVLCPVAPIPIPSPQSHCTQRQPTLTWA